MKLPIASGYWISGIDPAAGGINSVSEAIRDISGQLPHASCDRGNFILKAINLWHTL